MKLGISTWTFPWAFGFPNYPKPSNLFTFNDLLNIAKRYDLDCIQIGQNTPLHQYHEKQLLEFHKNAKEKNIEIQAGTDGVDPDWLKKYLEIAKMLESKVLRTYVKPENVKDGLNKVQESIRSIIGDFERENIILLIENAEYTPTSFLKKLVESVNSEYLRLLIDTANQLAVPEPLTQVLENMLPYAIEIHVKDYTVKRFDNLCGFQIYGVRLGEGCLDIDWLLNKLITGGKKDITLILEQWVPFTKTIEDTVRIEYQWGCSGIELLKRKLAELGLR